MSDDGDRWFKNYYETTPTLVGAHVIDDRPVVTRALRL